MNFKSWMEKIDMHIIRTTGGLTSDNLPDFCYRDHYNDKDDADSVAVMVLEESGYVDYSEEN